MGKQEKLARLTAALTHREGDRVPVSDSFWRGFVKNAKNIWGQDCDLFEKFDLDYVIVAPNMDPIIKDFEIISRDGLDITVKTGFGATVMRRSDLPMPHYDAFSVNEPEEMEHFIIESARNRDRLYRAGQDQLNCLNETISESIPCWDSRVSAYCGDYPVFGAICEGYEYLWRCIGTENSLMWSLSNPEEFERFVKRIGEFLVDLTRYQIEESRGRLSGMLIFGDVAYVNGMLFSPEIWRTHFKPIVSNIISVCRDAGLLTIYHGCGDAEEIFEDFIEIGLHGYNPLEVKAGLDIVKLKEQYGHRLAFVGNIDVRILESGDINEITREVLTKLKAAQGGGWVCQSDHSISANVSPKSYEHMVSLVREYGTYPLDLEMINRKLNEIY